MKDGLHGHFAGGREAAFALADARQVEEKTMDWKYDKGVYRATTNIGNYYVKLDYGSGLWEVRLVTPFELFFLGLETDSRLGMSVAGRDFRERNVTVTKEP